ncbi:MAG: signal recognition particle protein [bacterium]
MFESLTRKMDSVFKEFRGRGKLNEKDVKEGLKEIRRILLAADVHYSVVKKFINSVEEKATGAEVLDSLSPAQQIIQIVREELEDVLGGSGVTLDIGEATPTPIMLVGLQGTGKTTTCGKMAKWYKNEGSQPLLFSSDDQRPAAQEQLEQIADENDLNIYTHDLENIENELKQAAEEARVDGLNPLIIDTAGRLNIDEPMIEEVKRYSELLPEMKVLLVIDGMMGQEALRVAEDFGESVELDGLVLTKMEGDARGGAAISAREVTGVPIVFLGTGEKIDDLQLFHPERMASRILGLGDVMSLIEEAEEAADEEEQQEMQQRLMEGKLTMEDVGKQLEQLQNMGPIEGILEKLPGGFQLKDQLQQGNFDPGDIDKMQAIIRSMTPEEKKDPDIIDGSRRKRIAKGSGTSPQMVNRLLKQFNMMKKMMQKMQDNQGMMQKMASQMGMGGGPVGGLGDMF